MFGGFTLTKPIIGKVAKILTEYEIALNIGSDHGVVQGMNFVISSSKMPVIDPDSKANIGTVSIEIARVKIYQVFAKFSLAETYGSSSVSLPYPSVFKHSSSRKKLNVKPDDLAEFNSAIEVGNTVKQIIAKD